MSKAAGELDQSKFRRRTWREIQAHHWSGRVWNLLQRPPPVAQRNMTISKRVPSIEYVTAEDVKAHLCLLEAFHKLREAHHDKWPAYVERCVAKFHDWINKLSALSDCDATRVLAANPPDLDVLMVWHTYLLVRCPFESREH